MQMDTVLLSWMASLSVWMQDDCLHVSLAARFHGLFSSLCQPVHRHHSVVTANRLKHWPPASPFYSFDVVLWQWHSLLFSSLIVVCVRGQQKCTSVHSDVGCSRLWLRSSQAEMKQTFYTVYCKTSRPPVRHPVCTSSSHRLDPSQGNTST